MFDNTNHYKLHICVIENKEQYYASFINGEGKKIEIEISEIVAKELFQTFVRKERNLRRSDERNLEHNNISEHALRHRALHKPKSLEDTVFEDLQNEELWKAIDTLPKIQRRRLILHYFGGFTYERIAKIYGCSIHSVYVAIERATESLKNIMI